MNNETVISIQWVNKTLITKPLPPGNTLWLETAKENIVHVARNKYFSRIFE